MTRHSHHHARIPVEPVTPWSWTECPPDTQWTPVVPITPPLKVVQAPFYTSCEDPAPEWAPNVIIRPAVRHHHNRWGGVPFLRTHWHDTIERHVYGTNPFSDTVNSGGSHWQ